MNDKYGKLKEYLASLGSLAVGFSGGADSAFLAAAAHEALGDSMIAVTAGSPLIPPADIGLAADFCMERGIRHFIAEVDPLADPVIRSNPADRCYHCKKLIFAAIAEKAREEGIVNIADGSNTDDAADYRPGALAVKELGILSPLSDAGLGKNDIREMSLMLGLPTWNRPSAACLASRIAYGEELTPEKLSAIDAAEGFIRSLGFTGVRVRMHGNLARIEVARDETARLAGADVRAAVTERLKELGFTYVTLDLEGYHMGSQNLMLQK